MERISNRLLNWASLLEDSTRDQAVTTSRMPFIHPHLALMPDAHLGLGATVGSVIPTLGAVMPAAVGVDIGCGMIAVRTQFTRDDVASNDARLPALRTQIERAIPLSAGRVTRRSSPRLSRASRSSPSGRRKPGLTRPSTCATGSVSWEPSAPVITSSR